VAPSIDLVNRLRHSTDIAHVASHERRSDIALGQVVKTALVPVDDGAVAELPASENAFSDGQADARHPAGDHAGGVAIRY
jgi:hypothetical protein